MMTEKRRFFCVFFFCLGVFFLFVFVCFLKEGGPFLRPSLFGIVWVGPRMHIQKFFSFPFFVFLFTSVSAFAFGSGFFCLVSFFPPSFCLSSRKKKKSSLI